MAAVPGVDATLAAMEAASRGTILVVDDEPTIVEVVARYMERAGFDVETAADGPSAIAKAIDHRPDLIVLDLMLPEIDGMEVMRILREDVSLKAAIIMLTARSEEADRLIGLRRGADDYVVKPFSPAELVARAEAVLRRFSPAATEAELIVHGDLEIDPGQRIVRLRGEEVQLTQLEFDLLAFIATHPGQVFSRDHLMDAVWKQTNFIDTGTVTVHIRRLRAKLEATPEQPNHIETVWGVGYRFRP
ncbi:MAG: response regulator transcription factor [Solirubrobacterales bacterium]